MKLQLNEKELNAYINAALNEEIDELFGSRARKQSRRMLTGQGWGNQRRADNSDISQTDADEECPQTLVGMITKMEQALVGLEGFVGIQSSYQNLAANANQRRAGGGIKLKKSLLGAIEALTQISERLKALESKTGMNQLMEEFDWGSAGVGAAAGAGATLAAKPVANAIKNGLGKKGAVAVRTTASTPTVGSALANAGKWATRSVIPSVAAKGATVGGVLTSPLAIATACFAIAQAATMAAANGRQRKIIRTYNCAAIIAKRMGNLAQAMSQDEEQQQTQQQEIQEGVNEINVRRGKKSFASIEQGMQQLSQIMQGIHSAMNGGSQASNAPMMPKTLNSPEEIKQFQEWANHNGYVDQDGQQLVPDGKFGRRTSYVYDQVAAKLSKTAGSVSENKMLKESRKVEMALQNLENSVGTTGTGGAAYADISRLSGGANASRRQSAQNIKEIIRTYPPVLNQYQRVLQQAGADVSGLRPLTVDQRPHRNYNVQELEAINQRIQELLSIAQTVEVEQPEDTNVTLPPKPVVKPNPTPKPQPEPTPEEPKTRDVGPSLKVDNSLSNGDATGKLTTPGNNDALERPNNNLSYQQTVSRAMAQNPAQARHIYDTNLQSGTFTDGEKRQMRQDFKSARDYARQNGLRESKTTKKLNEQEFKNLIKETLKEIINK